MFLFHEASLGFEEAPVQVAGGRMLVVVEGGEERPTVYWLDDGLYRQRQGRKNS